jgi:dihydroorotate dehydrogenase
VVYRTVRRAFFLVPAERIHTWVFAALRTGTAPPPVRRALKKRLAPHDPALASTVFGVRFPGPMGLAAGFDKNGEGLQAWGAMGFGYAEVGTVTAQAQPGNPRPRMFRLPEDRALLNRLGFNNNGAGELALRLARHTPDVPIGVNIGKTKIVPAERAVDDYRASARLVGPLATYLVVNVSSPNTPGLRNLQAVEVLRPLLLAVRQALDSSTDRHVPLLVKIAPDLTDEQVDAVADLALELSLDGIIATNTTISRAGLSTAAEEVEAIGAGGLSGPPVRARALEVLHRLRSRVGPDLVLIAAGGITSGDDAYERIRAGATLVQAYTAFIYAGPLWPRRVHRELAARLRADGWSSLAAAVGTSELEGPR